jgi:hypothetical protein
MENSESFGQGSYIAITYFRKVYPSVEWAHTDRS